MLEKDTVIDILNILPQKKSMFQISLKILKPTTETA
jgi:hypothetical protein